MFGYGQTKFLVDSTGWRNLLLHQSKMSSVNQKICLPSWFNRIGFSMYIYISLFPPVSLHRATIYRIRVFACTRVARLSRRTNQLLPVTWFVLPREPPCRARRLRVRIYSFREKPVFVARGGPPVDIGGAGAIVRHESRDKYDLVMKGTSRPLFQVTSDPIPVR